MEPVNWSIRTKGQCLCMAMATLLDLAQEEFLRYHWKYRWVGRRGTELVQKCVSCNIRICAPKRLVSSQNVLHLLGDPRPWTKRHPKRGEGDPVNRNQSSQTFRSHKSFRISSERGQSGENAKQPGESPSLDPRLFRSLRQEVCRGRSGSGISGTVLQSGISMAGRPRCCRNCGS